MFSDSLPCAALLFAAAVAGWMLAGRWRAAARLYLRFAAILLSALAVCAAVPDYPELGAAAALFVLPLAAGALAVAAPARLFSRCVPDLAAGLLLAAMLVMGLAAALTGWAMLALMPVALCGLVIVAVALGGGAPLAALSALALLAAVPAFLQQGAGRGVLLFLAAAILGLSRSADAVEQAAADGRNPAIGRLG